MKNINPTVDKETLEKLHEMGLLYLSSMNQDNNPKNKFWSCFSSLLNANLKEADGKQRSLSIIAKKFSYNKLNNKLKIYN